MESLAGMDISDVNIRPKTVYGLRTDVLGNIHFSLDQDIIYPVEGVLTLHDYVNKTQRFMKFDEDVNPLIIQISSSRKILAVLEDVAKQGQQISLYDLETLKKRRSLSIPKYESQRPIIQMQFVNDSKGIVLLTKPPDELLFLFSLEAFSTVYESRPTMSFSRGYVQCLACHPTENNIVAVGGDSILLFMSKSEKGFNILQNIKIDFQITTEGTQGEIHTQYIYQVAGKLHKPRHMKEAVKQMFENYANDNELKRYVQIEEQVRQEFERQRRNVENCLVELKNKTEDNEYKQKYQKILQQNIALLNEIDALRKSNKELEQNITRFVALQLLKNKKKIQQNKK